MYRLYYDITRTPVPRKNQCHACYKPICGDCKEPQHPSKTDTVFRWCLMCFAKVEKCEICRDPLSKD